MSARLQLARALKGSPWDGKVWRVGGAVRDELLGRQSPDEDFVVEGDALAVAQFLFDQGVSEIVPVTYPRFGTALIHLDGKPLEFASARKDSYRERDRKPDVAPATLEQDALRRDFTCNALLQDLETGAIRDPLGIGREDLDAGILRTPREPVLTFKEDPLRMLRAVRFRHQLGFRHASGLAEAIRGCAHHLQDISQERIRDEFLKMLSRPTAAEAIRELSELQLLKEFLPEAERLKEVEQGSFHHLDAWNHTLLVVENAWNPREEDRGTEGRLLSLAALLHDIAKPETRTVDEDGRTRFFGHENVGAAMAGKILRRLRLPEAEVEASQKLVKNHMRLGSVTKFNSGAARRLVRDLGEHLPHLFALVEADMAALRPGALTLDLTAIREMTAKVRLESEQVKWESPLSGAEIMEIMGVGPGPNVGKFKRVLEEAVLDGTLRADDRDGAICLLRDLSA